MTSSQYESFLGEALSQSEAEGIIVLDGSPRDVSQVLVLRRMLEEIQRVGDVLGILLQLSDAEAERRLRGRISEEGARADEHLVSAHLRITTQAEPIMECARAFQARWHLISIDAHHSPNVISAVILDRLA
jgi:adenylate kinase family enzyme